MLRIKIIRAPHTGEQSSLKRLLSSTRTIASKYVTNKYPPQINRGYSHAADVIVTSHSDPLLGPQLKLKGDIITSLRKQNKGRANGLSMDSLDIFIRLVKRNDSRLNQAIRLEFSAFTMGRLMTA